MFPSADDMRVSAACHPLMTIWYLKRNYLENLQRSKYFTKYARKLVMCNKNYTSDFTEHYSIWQEEQTVNEISNMFTWWKSRALVRSSTQDTTS